MPRRLGSDFVFINPATGERWDGTSIRRHFLKACEAIGIDVKDGEQRLWFHDTRRSGVTNARKRGVPESVCMRISGHRTTKVFQRYNIVDGSDLKQAARRIEAGRLQESEKRWQEDVKVVDGAPTPHSGSTGNHS